LGRSPLGLPDRESAGVGAPRSRRNPNRCLGGGARSGPGRDGRERGRTERMETTNCSAAAVARFAGIEVSQATPAVALRPSGEPWCSTHEEGGMAALGERRRRLAPEVLVLEAPGGWQRLVVAALALAVAQARPWRWALAVRGAPAPRRPGGWPRPPPGMR